MSVWKRLLLLMIASVSLFLAGCSDNAEVNNQKYQSAKEIMGTFLTVTAYGENAQNAVDAAFNRAYELESVFSPTIEDSEICYVNANALTDYVEVSDDMYHLIESSLYYSNLSDGAFDFTMGELIDLWGFSSGNPSVPDENDILPLVNLKDYQYVLLDETKHSVKFESDTVTLNFGAIAKGYIADEIKSVLLNYNVKSALIDLGGNILTVGEKTDGSLWKIAITDPLDKSDTIAVISVKDESIVTSGNYEKYFTQNGVTYHHILDPKTGYSAENGIISATIISDNSERCDALSTATFVLGKDKALDFIENIENTEAVFVDSTGEIFTTSGIDAYSFEVMNE